MFKIIDELKRSDPARRQKMILRMQEKNYNYLKSFNPDLAQFIHERGTGPYGIRVTDKSVEVFLRESGELCHPPAGLFEYMSDFGYWHHSGWVDKILIRHVVRGEGLGHAKNITGFLEALYQEMPELIERMQGSLATLPKMRDGRRYSGPVIFLGVFTGIHIMSYLNRTAVRDIFLIEPDLDRFSLSCFFLDYEMIEREYGRILLHVGPNPPQFPIDQLTVRAPITASAWVRLLPAYPAGDFDEIVNRLTLRWRALSEVFVPMDRELGNLINGARNIQSKLPLPIRPPVVSKNLAIAIVASGPSLEADLVWLKKNQKRLLIFASVSCVRVLQSKGIRVDFQCTLDTEIDDDLFELLRLDPDVPLVAYYKLNPEIVKRFKKVYLLPEDGKANVVRFKQSFTHTHPTTGNLTTAFAAWCKPSTLIFIGLDLGFRDPKQSHVKGGWHDENDGIGHQSETGLSEHIPVTANFPESEGEILTMGYYNNARFSIEDCVASIQAGCRVLNFADGARIEGAVPMRSKEFQLPPYPELKKDLVAICAGFSTNYNDAFEPYELSGKELIEELRGRILQEVRSEKDFDWSWWARAIDGAMSAAYAHFINKHRDLRLEIYAKLITDLLSEWYRAMILTASLEEAERLYKKGVEKLDDVFANLPWNDILDSVESEN